MLINWANFSYVLKKFDDIVLEHDFEPRQSWLDRRSCSKFRFHSQFCLIWIKYDVKYVSGISVLIWKVILWRKKFDFLSFGNQKKGRIRNSEVIEKWETKTANNIYEKRNRLKMNISKISRNIMLSRSSIYVFDIGNEVLFVTSVIVA